MTNVYMKKCTIYSRREKGKERMNILQLVPKLNVGGVEKGTIEVARYLTLNGHKAIVVSGGGRLEKELHAVGARHYTLSIGNKNPFAMVHSYFKLKNIIMKENVNIVHARSRIPALVGFFAAKSTGRIFLTTAHGQYKSRLITRVMGWGKYVITANETMARYMKEKFDVPLRKIRIVPRGVDLRKFSFISPEEKTRLTFRIGMIARFTPLKGHLDFLKAMSYVARQKSNIKIVLMGDRGNAKEEYMKKIYTSIKRLMIEDIVEFVDSDQNVDEVLKDMDVLVSANQSQEAFGRSIIEAQARGTLVVATRIGGVVENIIPRETGLLCEPGDPFDIAEKIFEYMDSPILMKQVAINARKYVEENFSLEKVMAQTVEVYSEALTVKNILIIKISSLGDVILSTPSIRAIRKRFPTANIKVLVDVKFREILDSCPYINEVITCDFKNRDKNIGFLKLAERLRSEDFDISIDLQNNRRSHLIAALSFVKERYGFSNGKFSFLLNRKINMPNKFMDPVEHQGSVLGLLGITGLDKRIELWTTADSDDWAEKLLHGSWLQKNHKLVAISLSASKKWKSKNWGINSMAHLADLLAKKKEVRVVVIGAKENEEEAKEFIKKVSCNPINVVGKTSIPQLVSLLKRCDVLLTGDSAPMHIAAGINLPFVAIFGPTSPKKHVPECGKKIILYKEMKCTPCYKSVCNKKNNCMNALKPNEVFDALEEIIKI